MAYLVSLNGQLHREFATEEEANEYIADILEIVHREELEVEIVMFEIMGEEDETAK